MVIDFFRKPEIIVQQPSNEMFGWIFFFMKFDLYFGGDLYSGGKFPVYHILYSLLFCALLSNFLSASDIVLLVLQHRLLWKSAIQVHRTQEMKHKSALKHRIPQGSGPRGILCFKADLCFIS